MMHHNILVSDESTRNRSRRRRGESDLWAESTAETHKFRTGAEAGGKHHFHHFVAKVSAQISESYNGSNLFSAAPSVSDRLLSKTTEQF